MRTYKQKTDRASVTQEQMQKATNDVLQNGKSVRAAAFENRISRMTLARYLKKLEDKGKFAKIGYASPRQIFNEEQEKKIKGYLLKASDIYFGLTPKDVCCLAYNCASQFQISYPDS